MYTLVSSIPKLQHQANGNIRVIYFCSVGEKHSRKSTNLCARARFPPPRQAQRREEARVAAEARAAALEEMKWEECVDESEAFVTAMLASVVRSLAEGPKTETELDQVCVCFA